MTSILLCSRSQLAMLQYHAAFDGRARSYMRHVLYMHMYMRMYVHAHVHVFDVLVR